MEPIRAAVTVGADPERAYAVFTEGLREWWPREFSWSQDVLEEIGIEPREGGFAYERGPHGRSARGRGLARAGAIFTVHWGRVLASEPPGRLVFTWQIGADRSPQPDPDKAGEVEVVFSGTDDGSTSVELEHRGWERHGEGAQEYRDGFEQSGAWPYALERFAAAVVR